MTRHTCRHIRWNYCRRVLSDGKIWFGAQCADCNRIIKTPEHGLRLRIKPADIPADAPIHPYREGGRSE